MTVTSEIISNRTQCTHYDVCVVTLLPSTRGFHIWVQMCQMLICFSMLMTVIDGCGSSLFQAIETQQKSFLHLKLVLSTDETKVMLFPVLGSGHKGVPQKSDWDGSHIYEYLLVSNDHFLTFRTHVVELVKPRWKLDYHFWNSLYVLIQKRCPFI